MRPLNNTSSSHSGPDPESRKHLITLDIGLHRYDDIAGYAGFCEALAIPMHIGETMTDAHLTIIKSKPFQSEVARL